MRHSPPQADGEIQMYDLLGSKIKSIPLYALSTNASPDNVECVARDRPRAAMMRSGGRRGWGGVTSARAAAEGAVTSARAAAEGAVASARAGLGGGHISTRRGGGGDNPPQHVGGCFISACRGCDRPASSPPPVVKMTPPGQPVNTKNHIYLASGTKRRARARASLACTGSRGRT